jgi:branched-chain amino acid transport system permease protein
MEYLLHVLIFMAIYAIAGASFNLLVGYTGLFSLAQAGLFGVGAYASALLTLRLDWPPLFAAAGGMAIAALVSAVVALPSLRVSGDYLVVTSFGIQVLLYSVFLNWTALTRGSMGLPGIPAASAFGLEARGHVGNLAVAAAALLFTVWVLSRVVRSPFGRVLRALREDEVVTAALGKDVYRFKVLAFVVAGMLAALGGSVYAHYVTFIDPGSFTLDESVFMLSIVIVGGTATLRGPLVGAVIVVGLPEVLRFLGLPESVAASVRQMFYGALLVLFMRLRPEGLVSEAAS